MEGQQYSSSSFFLYFYVFLFFILVLSFFRGFSIISSVRYFFVEAYPFKNVCQMEIFVIVCLPKEYILNKQFVSLCKLSKTLKILKKNIIKCSFYIVILKRVLFRGKFHLGHSLYYFQIYSLFHLLLRTKSTQRMIGCQNGIRKG